MFTKHDRLKLWQQGNFTFEHVARGKIAKFCGCCGYIIPPGTPGVRVAMHNRGRFYHHGDYHHECLNLAEFPNTSLKDVTKAYQSSRAGLWRVFVGKAIGREAVVVSGLVQTGDLRNSGKLRRMHVEHISVMPRDAAFFGSMHKSSVLFETGDFSPRSVDSIGRFTVGQISEVAVVHMQIILALRASRKYA
jgi:hypothetical protein